MICVLGQRQEHASPNQLPACKRSIIYSPGCCSSWVCGLFPIDFYYHLLIRLQPSIYLTVALRALPLQCFSVSFRNVADLDVSGPVVSNQTEGNFRSSSAWGEQQWQKEKRIQLPRFMFRTSLTFKNTQGGNLRDCSIPGLPQVLKYNSHPEFISFLCLIQNYFLI